MRKTEEEYKRQFGGFVPGNITKDGTPKERTSQPTSKAAERAAARAAEVPAEPKVVAEPEVKPKGDKG